MSEPIITKTCSKCKQVKLIKEFYRDKSKKDGLKSDCKSCEKQYEATPKRRRNRRLTSRQWQRTPKGRISHNKGGKIYRLRHPEKSKAKDAVHHAIEAGRLPKASKFYCSKCEKRKAQQYHHPLYDVLLLVIPVCRKCHKLIHSNRQ